MSMNSGSSAEMEQVTSAAAAAQFTQQMRIFLWAVPRSISTAVFRAMMNKSRCKVQ